MVPRGKWIDGICADSGVENVARRSLEARLTTVNYWLPLAAYLAEQDVEHVHRLRVSTRRAMATLKLYRDWLPRRSYCWLKKRLKIIRRAAGDARDLDVLAERLLRDYGDRAAPVLSHIAQYREAVQPAIVEVAERCRNNDRFVRKTGKLLAAIKSSSQTNGQPVCFREWAAEQLAGAAAPFFAAMPDEPADFATLHQFRIRAKALRYTIELVAHAFDSDLRDARYPVVEVLQERLGRIQDHATASACLGGWADDCKDIALREALCELAANEAVALRESVEEFHAWWTPQRAGALRSGLRLTAPRDATTKSPQVAHQT